MNILFYASDKEREIKIAEAFIAGAKRHGENCQMAFTHEFNGIDEWADVACMIGVKGHSKMIMEAYLKVGKHTVYFDKGYFNGAFGPRSKYCRVSVNSFQPLSYFQTTSRPHDRFNALKIDIAPRYTKGENILICGGSLKYAQWHNLPSVDGLDPATSWAKMVVEEVRKYTDRPIVYSPKPSWQDAVSVPGAAFRKPPGVQITTELKTTWCVITYGSNAALDALIAGVPAIVLGDGIAKPLSTILSNIENPFFPDDIRRKQFMADVAYCQFSLPEMKSGLAWSILKPEILT